MPLSTSRVRIEGQEVTSGGVDLTLSCSIVGTGAPSDETGHLVATVTWANGDSLETYEANAIAAIKAEATAAGYTLDSVYLNTVKPSEITTLPAPSLDYAGRLYYQNRTAADDLLYVGIVDDAGDPKWVLLSQINENQDEVGLWKWTQMASFQDYCYGVASTGSELLNSEYVLGGSYARVRRRNLSTGASIATFGSVGTGNGQFQAPRGIAVSSAGNIHVSDNSLNRVVQFNSSRTFVRNIGSTGTGNGNLSGPIGVACDSSNNVYVADYGNKRVAVFNSSGTWQRNIGSAGSGSGQLQNPSGVCVNSIGELFVADSFLNKIAVYNATTGALVREFGSYGSASGEYSNPIGIAVDSSDNLYIADSLNNRVVKTTSTGSVITIISGAYGATTTSWTQKPNAIATSSSNIYVTSPGSSSSYGYPSGVKMYSIVPDGGIEVSANSAATASSRSKLNFIGGAGIGITVADDSTNSEADITVKINPTVTMRSSSSFSIAAGGNSGLVTVSCSTGEIAIAGGWAAGGEQRISAPYSYRAATGTGWTTMLYNPSAVQVNGNVVYAICLTTQ